MFYIFNTTFQTKNCVGFSYKQYTASKYRAKTELFLLEEGSNKDQALN